MKMQLSENMRLETLPSLALINLPQVPGIGIIYSEISGVVIDLFEASNLRGEMTASRQQNAFNVDPECRLAWMEIELETDRKTLIKQLRETYFPELMH
jgi:hypothetical protein